MRYCPSLPWVRELSFAAPLQCQVGIPRPPGREFERHLLVKRARMAGVLIFDYQHRYEEAVTRLAEWVRDGRLRYREDIADGIENCSGAIAEL